MMRYFIHNLITSLKEGKNYKVSCFYPYTSIVQNRIVEMNPNFKGELDETLIELYNIINGIIKKKGIMPDNKTVVRIDPIFDESKYWHKEGSGIFVGKYDGMVSVGFSVFTEKGDEKYIKVL